MVNWLRTNFGTPDVTVENPMTKAAISAKIGNRKGIYAIAVPHLEQAGTLRFGTKVVQLMITTMPNMLVLFIFGSSNNE